MQRLNFLVLLFFTCFISFAQNSVVYFDRIGNSTNETNSYYYRENVANQKFVSYYTSSKTKYFEGQIINANTYSEKENLYKGECVWYHKNGAVLAKRNFDASGKEIGKAIYYFENGQKQKEIDFDNTLSNSYLEYEEDGSVNKIFEEYFKDNKNDWYLVKSDLGEAKILENKLLIEAFNEKGISRYINVPIQSESFTIELGVNIFEIKSGKLGLIYGFKNWDNYHYFLISNSAFYLGSVYEGISSNSIDGMYCASLKKDGDNVLKILSNGENDYFSVNGEVIYKSEAKKLYGSNVGVALSGFTKTKVNSLKIKELDVDNVNSSNTMVDKSIKKSGSGIFLTTNGYIVTNHHVIEDSKQIIVEVNINDQIKSFKAKLIQKDEVNDLAILKIDDAAFTPLNNIEYSFAASGTIDVGASVFTIGYPLALNGMGKNAKFTDGKISSKTGYNNSINNYQTSVAVQPGNSGGPLFNKSGELVGIICATVQNTDNVSYAIKLSYLTNLIDLLPESIKSPNNTTIKNLSLEQQIKALSKNVVLIKCK